MSLSPTRPSTPAGHSDPAPADPDCFSPTRVPRLVDESLLREVLAALDAVINCEPFADVSPPGTEGFLVYEVVAAARERVADALAPGGAGPREC
jgi:hypothetical protein